MDVSNSNQVKNKINENYIYQLKEDTKQKLRNLVIDPNDSFTISYTDSESPNDIKILVNKKKVKNKLSNESPDNWNLSSQDKNNSSEYDSKSKNKLTNISQKRNSSRTKRQNSKKHQDSKSINNILNNTQHQNLNSHITNQLEKMLEYHTEENNTFETLAYRRAISQLKNAEEKITKESQLSKYKYIGKSIKQKIKEIITTGKLKKLDFLKIDEKNIIVNKLKTVHGIGLQLANKLYLKGIKTIEDLRKNEDLLNSTQKIGLKYYDDLIQRIPRKECEEIFKEVKKEAYKIISKNYLHIEICGSYRRSKKSIGDLDILMTVKDNRNINGILSKLVERLFEKKIILEILSHSKEDPDLLKHTFMGICKLRNNPHRRIDIKIYYKEAFPFAILYFTGSAYFNRSLRLYAKKNHFKLTDSNLIKFNPLSPNEAGKDIKCENEEEIFKALGLEYIAPIDRDI